MWSISILILGLAVTVSATWRPIVGPSSSSFNKKIPFGESHTYYGNEFLSEYAGLGDDHLLVPSHSSAILGSEHLATIGNTVSVSG